MGNGSSAAKDGKATVSVDDEPFSQRHLRLKEAARANFIPSDESVTRQQQVPQISRQADEKNSPPQQTNGNKEPSRGLFGLRRKSDPDLKKTAATESTRALRRKSSKSEDYVDTDEEVDELETTLNSLGVVGRSLWDDAQAYEAMKAKRAQQKHGQRKDSSRRRTSETADEPRAARRRYPNLGNDDDDDGGVNCDADDGIIARELPVRNIGASSVAKGRRIGAGRIPVRNFHYSWEKGGIKEDDGGDEWEYKGNQIQGVDIEKFKAVNSKDKKSEPVKIEPQNLIPRPIRPSAAEAPTSATTTTSVSPTVPNYDETEAKLIASIENEFVY